MKIFGIILCTVTILIIVIYLFIKKTLHSRELYKNSKPKKIALCFLIYDKINHEQLWYDWLTNVDKQKYNIYIHYKEDKPLQYFEQYKLNKNIKTSWGDISLVFAQNLLLKEGLNDPNNQHFIFVSGSCIPIKTFHHLYQSLDTNYSYFNKAPDEQIFPRCNKVLEFIDKKYIKKASMNSILNRKHAQQILNNKRLLKKWFTNVSVPDEHCYLTLLYYLHLQHQIKLTPNLSYATTFAAWPDTNDYQIFRGSVLSKNSPNEYKRISNKELQYLINSQSFFARKFLPECDLQYLYKHLLNKKD